MKRKLVIFNIEMDQNSPYLAANIDLVESFATHYEQISVYATHVGSTKMSQSIEIVELGGGSFFRRIKASFKLIFVIIKISRSRENIDVFYHMITRIPAFVGKLFKFLGVTQFLWYSHSIADKYLEIAVRNVDFVFSPTCDSLPMKTSKLKTVGHGVKSSDFQYSNRDLRHGVITVGRVVPIKKITELIDKFGKMSTPEKELLNPLTIVGDIKIDPTYVEKIKTLSMNTGLEVVFTGQIPRAEILQYLNRANFYYLGTPKSIDKAALEASMCGCIVLSENLDAISILGSNFIKVKNRNELTTIEDQLKIYAKVSTSELKEIQSAISQESRHQNDINVIVNRMVESIHAH